MAPEVMPSITHSCKSLTIQYTCAIVMLFCVVNACSGKKEAAAMHKASGVTMMTTDDDDSDSYAYTAGAGGSASDTTAAAAADDMQVCRSLIMTI